MSNKRKREQQLRAENIAIGTFGSSYSFTYCAANKFFDARFKSRKGTIAFEPFACNKDIFDKVASGELTYGFIPAESSNHG
jgi:prephenate dehydratase